MSDYNSLPQQPPYLSTLQQDLLLAALSSNNPPPKDNHPVPKQEPDTTPLHVSTGSFSISPTALDNSNNSGSAYESPFVDFNPDADFDFHSAEDLIGDLPDGYLFPDEYEPGDKRKGIEEKSENSQEESGKKRRESDERVSRKPGRKPLTSEPTTKRKAQNRAAQRAFRERKEQHLKDLETKIHDLQKASDSANQENSLLRAQLERMQVELREYRTRLSYLTNGNGASALNAIPGSHPRGHSLGNNDFLFDFPKFGDLPGSHLFNNSQAKKTQNSPTRDVSQLPGILGRDAFGTQAVNGLTAGKGGPAQNQAASSPAPFRAPTANLDGQLGKRGEAVSNPPNVNPAAANAQQTSSTSGHDTSNSGSPSSSVDSRPSHSISSNGTSPESSPYFSVKPNKDEKGASFRTTNGEKSFCDQLALACGSVNNPIPAVRSGSESASNTPNQAEPTGNSGTDFGLDFMTQQNGGQFDPVLFGDWREPQDAILMQDFGSYFDDAFPLPDLGSPSHNFSEAVHQPAPKKDLVSQIDQKLDEEVVPGEDNSKMLTCTKIWDRLQSMDKFRNGEIDVDNLCSELRTKARCSESGVVVDQQDVDKIMYRNK